MATNYSANQVSSCSISLTFNFASRVDLWTDASHRVLITEQLRVG